MILKNIASCPYVDTILAIINSNERQAKLITARINKIHKTLKCTYEIEKNNTTDLLDRKSYNKKISTKIRI